jgi:hypothetical protein
VTKKLLDLNTDKMPDTLPEAIWHELDRHVLRNQHATLRRRVQEIKWFARSESAVILHFATGMTIREIVQKAATIASRVPYKPRPKPKPAEEVTV